MSSSAARPLSVVDGDDDETVGPSYEAPKDQVIGDFEGQAVNFARAKVQSASNVEIDDKVLRVDDKVVLVLELRCVGIEHKVDQNTGKMTRLQALKTIDAFVAETDFETLRQSGL